ncbi:MAG: DUF973 family protein [Candidatus Bathyarchaeia archaeon]|nr:DUF973 family protein [Candidatus Bathyarchaeota archaeon]
MEVHNKALLLDGLKRIHEASLMAFISLLLVFIGIIGIPLSMYVSQATGYQYLFRYQYMENLIAGIVSLIIIIIIGVLLFVISVLGPLVEGSDKLGLWSFEFRTGARLVHLFRTGFLLLLVGAIAIPLGLFLNLALGVILIILGILILVLPPQQSGIDIIRAMPGPLRVPIGIILLLGGIASFLSNLAGLIIGIALLIMASVLLLLGGIGLSIILIGLDRAFRSSALWIAGILNLIGMSFLSFFMIYMEIPEIIKRIGELPDHPPPPTETPKCSMCGEPLIWIPQHQKWYCYKCGRYEEKERNINWLQ